MPDQQIGKLFQGTVNGARVAPAMGPALEFILMHRTDAQDIDVNQEKFRHPVGGGGHW